LKVLKKKTQKAFYTRLEGAKTIGQLERLKFTLEAGTEAGGEVPPRQPQRHPQS
jgi:hypothetical protein